MTAARRRAGTAHLSRFFHAFIDECEDEPPAPCARTTARPTIAVASAASAFSYVLRLGIALARTAARGTHTAENNSHYTKRHTGFALGPKAHSWPSPCCVPRPSPWPSCASSSCPCRAWIWSRSCCLRGGAWPWWTHKLGLARAGAVHAGHAEPSSLTAGEPNTEWPMADVVARG
eukprot:864693-Prymnesium_polylepis.1